jgi:hypothetical protein
MKGTADSLFVGKMYCYTMNSFNAGIHPWLKDYAFFPDLVNSSLDFDDNF